MQKLLLILATMLLISAAPAAFAQNGSHRSARHASAAMTTTGTAKAGAKGSRTVKRADPAASPNAALPDRQHIEDEGRSSEAGSGGSSGM